MYEKLEGLHVIVRSSASGVWFGVLQQAEQTGDTCVVTLSHARRIWSWKGAGSCSGLAAHGPSGGKVAPPVDVVVSGCCEVLVATDKAVEQFEIIPEWRP